jgi:hypothetical protein
MMALLRRLRPYRDFRRMGDYPRVAWFKSGRVLP